MGDEASDEVLIQRVADGDLICIGALYDRYVSVVLPVALRIVRDRTEAEDVVHDAFVAISARAHQYTPGRGSVAGWLIFVVRNLAIDRVRRYGRRSKIARATLEHEPVEATPSAADSLEHGEMRRAVQKALEVLPEVQRVALTTAFFEGLSYPEIAEREGVPTATIKSRAARGMATLRETLQRDGFTWTKGELP